MKKLPVILALLLLINCLTGCAGKSAALDYHFEDLTVSLPVSYVNLTGDEAFADCDFLFSDGRITLAGIREEKAQLPELTLETFGQLVIHTHELDCQLLQSDGITFFKYEAGDPAFIYTVGIWETEDAFWSVQTYCKSEDYAAVREDMWQLLRSVTL